jgi:NADPH-dependent curcumin reductase CurA
MSLVVRMVRRPEGEPVLSDFSVDDVAPPVIGDGQALVRSDYLSLDPGLRSTMRDVGGRNVVGEVVPGSALGHVVESRDPALPVGAVVRGRLGWVEHGAVTNDQVEVVPVEADIDLPHELGVLGLSGFVAYVGFLDLGKPQAGETVFVSGAAGAIGSMVGQMAKIYGCRVIGSAGSDEKVDYLRGVGFDEAFNYKKTSPGEALGKFCPDGFQLYFDNVGGEHLQAAVDHLALHGRIVNCGSVSAYNDSGPGPALRNIRRFVTGRLSMHGYVIWDHMDRAGAHRADTLAWLRSGQLAAPTTITDGVDQTPQAFIAMLHGGNIGKALIRV